jgi:hypothetical protein
MMWNSGSAQPAGLFPMFLDHLLGLPQRDWAGIETGASESNRP